jgi:hypothetical protein
MSRTGTAGKSQTRTSRPCSGRSRGRDARVAGFMFFRIISALAACLLMVAGNVRGRPTGTGSEAQQAKRQLELPILCRRS